MAEKVKALDFEKPIAEIEEKIEELQRLSQNGTGTDFSIEIEQLMKHLEDVKRKVYSNLTPWQIVQISRHPQRPLFLDYVKMLFDEFVELHGDRLFGDDRAIITGVAKFNGQKVFVVGQEKGRTTEEKVKHNFGMPHPEGYRKALRIMKLAEKFKKPVLTFVDTPGAYPGIGAEERGQAEAIARNLYEMSALKTPIVVTVIGEGGSGGALGIGVGDVILMLEYATYSVISPEGCASILWRDASVAPKAAEALKLTAKDLLKLGVIDEIVKEPFGGAHRDPQKTAENLKKAIQKHLSKLKKIPIKRLVNDRYQKFRKMGMFREEK